MNTKSKSKQSKDPKRLAIWGTSGAGKTTYLTKLYQVLINQGWRVGTDRRAQKFIDQNLRKIDRLEFPERTPPVRDKPLEFYRYQLTYEKPRQKTYKVALDFIDASGEFYEQIMVNEAIVNDKQNGSPIKLIDYLLSCHGILFLLDPLRTEEDGDSYYTLLRELFLEMKIRQQDHSSDKEENALLEQFVAFVITKLDHESVWEKYKDEDPIYAFVDLLSPHGTLEWLQNSFILDKTKLLKQIQHREYQSPHPSHRCQFFTISSIGMYQDSNGKWVSGVTNSKNKKNNPSIGETSGAGQGSTTQEDPMGNFLGLGVSSVATSETSSNESSGGSLFGGSSTPPVNYLEKTGNIDLIVNKKLEPIAVDKPVEWLIQGIENFPISIIDPSSINRTNEEK